MRHSKISDFTTDGLYAWLQGQVPKELSRVTPIQIKADNGPESNGRRTFPTPTQANGVCLAMLLRRLAATTTQWTRRVAQQE